MATAAMNVAIALMIVYLLAIMYLLASTKKNDSILFLAPSGAPGEDPTEPEHGLVLHAQVDVPKPDGEKAHCTKRKLAPQFDAFSQIRDGHSF